MGLLQKLIAEAAEEAKRKPPKPPPVPPVTYTQPAEPSKPVDSDRAWITQTEPIIDKVSCPSCNAERGSPCANNLHGIHHGRLRTYATCYGKHPEDFNSMPYLRWPNADDYKRWGVFKTKSGGNLYKKPSCHESTHAAAVRQVGFLNNAEEKKTDWRKRDRYTVAPMYQPGGEGEWLRYDLTLKKGA